MGPYFPFLQVLSEHIKTYALRPKAWEYKDNEWLKIAGYGIPDESLKITTKPLKQAVGIIKYLKWQVNDGRDDHETVINPAVGHSTP